VLFLALAPSCRALSWPHRGAQATAAPPLDTFAGEYTDPFGADTPLSFYVQN